MRRIKTISVTIPCLTGPYISIAATLTLVKHQYRVSPMVPDKTAYMKPQRVSSGFRTDRIPISSVAISSGINDNGVFDLNFRDERYMPFEGAGAISEWKIELPTEVRQFDYQTISDVVLNMRYTSKDGSSMLKRVANDSLAAFKTSTGKLADNGQLTTLFDLAGEFSGAWYQFTKSVRAGELATLSLDGLSKRLPFWSRLLPLKPVAVKILISPASDLWRSRIKLSSCGKEEWKAGTLGTNCSVLEGVASTSDGLDMWKLTCSPSLNSDFIPEKLLLLVSFAAR